MAHYPSVLISGGGGSIFWNKGTTNDASDKTSDIYRLGSLLIGSASIDSNDRLVISSTTGTASFVVDNFGNLYNGYYSDLKFGYNALPNSIKLVTVEDYDTVESGSGYTPGTYTTTAIFYSGVPLVEYPTVQIIVDGSGFAYINSVLTNGSGWKTRQVLFTANIPGGSGLIFAIWNNFTSNSAFGNYSLYSNTNGGNNSAFGNYSLQSNTTGSNNSAFGNYSLYLNNGGSNSAFGFYSMYSNTVGNNNSAFGNYSLQSNTTGTNNLAFGSISLSSNTTGSDNIAIGNYSLSAGTSPSLNIAIGYQSLFFNNSSYNIAIGYQSLFNNNSSYNIAIGYQSQYFNTSSYNTSIGYQSLYSNNLGNSNTSVGYASLYSTTSGSLNSAFGESSLYFNTTGSNNSAFGRTSLYRNTTGSNNSAFGLSSLWLNTTGYENTSVGSQTLQSNTTGYQNTAIGVQALFANTVGINNLALGWRAGYFISGTTSGATNSNNSIFIGVDTRPSTGNNTNEIVIGHGATGNGSNSVTLGNNSVTNTYLKGILNMGSVTETTITSVNATASLVNYDFSTGSIWYHATASTNYSANFTNLPTTNNQAITATIIISQGATGYSPTSVRINGVTQSIKWGGGTYSVSTNKVDVIGFTFIRTGATWSQVLGQINSFS